jgi:hypothetical protein
VTPEAYRGGGEQSLGSFGCPLFTNEDSVDVMLETHKVVGCISFARILLG